MSNCVGTWDSIWCFGVSSWTNLIEFCPMILHYSWQCLEDATSFDYYGVLVKGGVEGQVERRRATKEATKWNKLFDSLLSQLTVVFISTTRTTLNMLEKIKTSLWFLMPNELFPLECIFFYLLQCWHSIFPIVYKKSANVAFKEIVTALFHWFISTQKHTYL